MKKWVGIFGGSFDPPHLGHLLAAVYALKVFEFDEVWLVPAFRHAFAKDLSPFKHRVDMCKHLMLSLGNQFKVSEIEKETDSDGKMLLTLKALKKKHKDKAFSLIVGSDTLKDRDRWYKFEEIENSFMVFVVPRTGSTDSPFAIPNISSTEIRSRLKKGRPLGDLLTPDVAGLVK